MNNYVQLIFRQLSTEQSEILIAQLNEIGFEGFEEHETSLKAFINESDFNESLVNEIAEKNNLSFTQAAIEETNWNAVWESNFEPVIVAEFVGIRADFHEPVAEVEHEIIITPKMSFGTGHHATTYMMIQHMQKIEFANKTVFDFGTGTGVLAILAEKLGASKIFAVDNDIWSIDNAVENLKRNSCIKVDLQKAENAGSGNKFDIILANINKNVILDNLLNLVEQLKNNGTLLLSGLLIEDEVDILSVTTLYKLRLIEKSEKSNWISLKFKN